ncbi:MAG: glycosyltransferase [Flavobacteriales bacterium]|nr:glycosyltransferase [Flavobacteriales bacterium]
MPTQQYGQSSLSSIGGKNTCNKLDKPRVLRIINRFNLGGPTYNVGYLTKYMEDEFETLLVGGMKDESEDSSEFIVEKLGLSPVIIPEMKREINFKLDRIVYKKIKQIIKDFRPDIVHTHASKSGAIGRLAAANMKVPIILHTFHGHVFHSYFGQMKTMSYKKIERYLAKKSTRLIAISDIQKHELAKVHKIAPENKFNVIPLGFDLQRFQDDYEEKRTSFRNKYNVQNDEIAIGIIGRLVPVKNHKLFLKGIKYLVDNSRKKIRVFIIGDGELRPEIEQNCNHLHLEFGSHADNKLITFTSWVRDVSTVYPGLDIVVLTSLNEGTPVSLIEAQAANKPIVSTNVGGIENVVIPQKTALLSNILDDQLFFENLISLAESETKRKSMEQYGWKHVQAKFSYYRLVSDMKQLYFELLEENKK